MGKNRNRLFQELERIDLRRNEPLKVPFAPVRDQAIAKDTPPFFQTIGDVSADCSFADFIGFRRGGCGEEKRTRPFISLFRSFRIAPVVSRVPDGKTAVHRRIDHQAWHRRATPLTTPRL